MIFLFVFQKHKYRFPVRIVVLSVALFTLELYNNIKISYLYFLFLITHVSNHEMELALSIKWTYVLTACAYITYRKSAVWFD